MRGEVGDRQGRDGPAGAHREVRGAGAAASAGWTIRSVASLTLLVIVAVLLVHGVSAALPSRCLRSTKALLLLALLVVISTLALRVGGSMLGIKLSPAQVGYLGMLWVVTAGMFIAVLVNPQVAVVIAALLSIVLSLMLEQRAAGMLSSALMTSLVGIYSVANIRDRNDLMRVGRAARRRRGPAGLGDRRDHQRLALGHASGLVLGGLVMPIGGDRAILLRNCAAGEAVRANHAHIAAGACGHEQAAAEAAGDGSAGNLHAPHGGRASGGDRGGGDRRGFAGGAGSRRTIMTSARSAGRTSSSKTRTSRTCTTGSTRRSRRWSSRRTSRTESRSPGSIRLPKIVLDVIAQHHGTSLVQYFYNQFDGRAGPVDRAGAAVPIPGPKPQTKEAAIVMLADSVEAASQVPGQADAGEDRDAGEQGRRGQAARRAARRVRTDVQGDQQDNRRSFVRALTGTMHARIEYPEATADGRKKLRRMEILIQNSAEDTGEARSADCRSAGRQRAAAG